MNKKISFIGIILALLLLTINSAFALQVTGIIQPPVGNPGTTVNGSFTVNDNIVGNVVTSMSAAVTGTLSSGSNTISSTVVSFTAIANFVADGATSPSVTVSVAIPSNQAVGTYSGTVTVSGTEGGATVTAPYTLIVDVKPLDVLTYDNTTALEIIGEEGQTNLIGTLQIKNTGNAALSGLTFDTSALDLSDRSNHVITISFSDPGTIAIGDTKTVTVTANYGDNIDLDTYGGVVNVKSVATGTTVLDSFKLDLKVFPEICSDEL